MAMEFVRPVPRDRHSELSGLRLERATLTQELSTLESDHAIRLQNRVLVLTADIGYHLTFVGRRLCPPRGPRETGDGNSKRKTI